MAEAIVVSAADTGFFRLLQGLVLSLRDNPLGAALPIGVYDLGLAEAERDWLAARGATVVVPDWDIDFPGRDAMPETFKAQAARPFLPKYFPGYETILWLDADCWVQTWDAVSWFLRIGRQSGLAIVPELDRAYAYASDPKHFANHCAFFETFFGDAGRDVGLKPILNVGAFAMRADSDLWTVWQETLAALLQRTDSVFCEQMALTYVAYLQPNRIVPLPSLYNWMCHHALPRISRQTGLLVETSPPFDPISIVHVSYKTKDEAVHRLYRTDGKPVDASLLYRQGHY